ncbi:MULTISPECIES: ChaN family lipoprotein [unclassified Pseudodesulfovibrio]|uniref:ChaN family lipoprotein n=1 Tax=unclassified Pseudodesulfovibrio TaxID=2661612 RepID=UPI000FEC0AC1|nr:MULTISPECIES: ChaN family lipoprotein [unclassified Pseudodesulfovibrio]MCJ2165224.1 ChaN family lipoprotein [Pseudodesulfovibrio sp. S3-i]RWU03278.1 PDZ domain-containing protein [Pseudodesulfovibrio sp. S3]
MMKYNLRTAKMCGVIPLGLLCLLFLGACVKNAPETMPETAPEVVNHPPLTVTFLPQKGEFISKYGDQLTIEEITTMADGYDYILMGEGHRNPWDHKVQQIVLKALSESGNGVSLGLEMVAVDMQPVLDDFGQGQVELDDLAEELQWTSRWGYDFSQFRDHFAIALRYSVPVAGLNVPTKITRKISKDGIESLSDEEKAFLPNEIVPPSTGQRTFLDTVFGQHEGLDGDDPEQRERFYLVQSIWDSKMAEEAVRIRRKYDWPVLVVAGSAHVELGWGIAKRIQWFDPGARVLTVMPWRGGEFDPEEGDVFFYSPDSYQSRMGALLTGLSTGGILVESVKRGSRAAEAGLRPGDILVDASGVPLEHLFSLHMAGTKVHEADEELVFTVKRGDQAFLANVGKLGVPAAEKKPDTAPAAEGSR